MTNSSFAQPTTSAIVSTYTPRQCGLATFAADTRTALQDERHVIVAVDDTQRDFPEEVKVVIDKHDRESYVKAAKTISENWDVASIQHEYGIYGGEDGAYVLDLVENLTVPAVCTLHTVLQRPSEGQRRVLSELCRVCSRVIVMSDRASDILEAVYGVPCDKIDVIPHGVPESDTAVPAPELTRFGNDPKLFTFGLISPGKGIEVAIDAVAKIKEKHPNVRYVVLGATHPELKRREGEAYREKLQEQIRNHGLEENVFLINEYATLDDLCGYLAAADIYVTPYWSKDQICSGTISYAVGFGLPIVTTPFIYAEELVEKGGGLLFPFGDSDRMAQLVTRLLDDPRFCGRLRNSAAILGRTMRWPVVAQRLRDTYAKAQDTVNEETVLLQRILEAPAARAELI